MVKFSGENWSGSLLINVTAKASGSVNSYSWYLESTAHSWVVEIAEEHAIEPNDLPLVGFGCGGWLYECKVCDFPENEIDFIRYFEKELSLVFTMFQQSKLTYIPAITACND